MTGPSSRGPILVFISQIRCHALLAGCKAAVCQFTWDRSSDGEELAGGFTPHVGGPVSSPPRQEPGPLPFL